MQRIREIDPNFFWEASEVLPGFSHQTLLTSVAVKGVSQDVNASHPLFGIDPIIVLAALISCFCVTSFLQSKY